jgi:FkbM family methyltransferase
MNFEYIDHYCSQAKWRPEMLDIAQCIKENVAPDPQCGTSPNNNDKNLVLDIGANQGLVSLPLGHMLPDCTVHCFEPVPENYNLLLKNIENNQLKNIVVHKYGFFKETGKTKMCVPHVDRYEAGNTGTYTAIFKEENKSLVEVDMKNFSTFLQNNRAMAEGIIAMKIDAESCEKFIITDQSLSLLKNLQVVVYECIQPWLKKRKDKVDYAESHVRIQNDLIKYGFTEASFPKTSHHRTKNLNKAFIKKK